MSHHVFKSLSRFVVVTAAVATTAFCVVPLLAIATGAYAALPTGVGAISRLLLVLLPQAIAVALPFAVAAAVFLVCRRLPVTRQVGVTVGAFAIAMALVTAALNVSVAPVTNAMYREMAFGSPEGRLVDGRHLNAPGGPGERFQMYHRWALPESVLVLAAPAMVASRVAPSHARQ